MLGGELAVLQAPMFDCLSLDPFALFDDGWALPSILIADADANHQFAI